MAVRNIQPPAKVAPDKQANIVLTWPVEIFKTIEAPDEPCPEVFDLTGRPRFLFHGPYIELPTGLWRARVDLELADEAGKRFMAIQFGVGNEFTTVDLPRRVEGPVVIEADLAVHTPGPAQIRLWVKWGAFHGTVRFRGAVVERIGDLEAASEPPSTAEAAG